MSHDDADPDDTGLESLRAAWRSMPDEEPPQRGFADLMAAARVKADQMAESAQPSLWERFVAMMRRPQVLALATIVILVGGAVFVSQHRGSLGASKEVTIERSREPAPENAATATATPGAAGAPVETESAPADNLERRAGHDEAGGDMKAPEPMVAGAVAKEVAKVDHKAAEPPPPEKPRPKLATGAKVAKKPPSKSKFSGGGEDSLFDAESDGESAPKGATTTGAAQGAAPDAQPAEPTVKQLHSQARAAAARNDCAAVRSLAKKIAAKDAPYYRANIATDTTLATCLN